ncbi:lipase member H-like isoform X3 [Homarus americanus]|uniref:lipase member H-like isoform X3 n=1 Tax=Homarus americanus TaxID=6706 RepID=UPI001C473AE1|nr:lipase member H-like isoform X3 [Homarus americanus]XP_042217720.1 lipase member H-like isoform X3 [Homarus americanus]XP_042217722.1 lipase member H-like isoform X3 [Homarus americanus]
MNVLRVLVVPVMVALVAVIVVKVYSSYPSGRVGVLFYYSTSLHEDRKEFKATKESIAALPVTPSTPVSIIIHGYTESSLRSWVVDLTDALLSHDLKSVVILVDYWDLVTISRPYMMINVRHIADITARMIDMLAEEKSVELTNIHIMGFSLGGRISGLIGDRIQTGTIGRMTGMDASYPWLPPRINEEFLDAGDAILVVNIRTSSIGSHSPPGHIDFYANGGLSQPGCQNWYFPDTAKQVCNHYRAVALMIEAVKYAGKEVFSACGCPDLQSFQNNTCDCQIVNNFGLYPNASVLGNFYFSTNSEPPYLRNL